MKLSVAKAIALRGALQNCDGHTVIVKEGENEKPIYCLFELGFEVNYAIAKNIDALETVQQTYIKQRNDLLKSLSKNGTGFSNPEEEPEAFAKFRAKEAEMLEAEINVPLVTIKKADLAKSKLPPSILSNLLPIIKE